MRNGPSFYLKSKGFTAIEVLIAVFVLGVAAVGVTGLATLGVRYSFESERQTVALGIANERTEIVRSLIYDDVGYTNPGAGEPDGVLERTMNVNRNQQSYTVETTVTLIDDPVNGELSEQLTESNADYKLVGVTVSWQVAGGDMRSVDTATYVAPAGSVQTCTPGEANACPGSDSAGSGACIPKVTCPPSGVCPSGSDDTPACPPGSQFCVECYSDSDCSAGETCNELINECVATPGACRADSDCSAGSVCQSGMCASACTSNADCGGSNVCNTETGVCSPSCVDGNSCSCPSGTSCDVDTGVCESVSSCSIDADCGSDDICELGECQPPVSCNSSDDCGAGQICGSDDICRTVDSGESCTTTNDCSDGEVCQAGRCTGPFDSCNSDADCGAGNSCFDGLCGPSSCSVYEEAECTDVVIDPGCGCPNTFGGRTITTYETINNPLPDPQCPTGLQVICQPVLTWTACPDLDCSNNEPAQCSDGIDNDGDGAVDCGLGPFPADPGCFVDWDYKNGICLSDDDAEQNPGECSDQIDNDNDGLVDAGSNGDPDCESFLDETESGSFGQDTGDLPGGGTGNNPPNIIDCPELMFNGKSFQFCFGGTNASWMDANAACAVHGGTLAVPGSHAENTWLANRAFEFSGSAGWWVGYGQDPDLQGSGGVVAQGWNSVKGSGSPTFWWANEPNDCCGLGDYEYQGISSEDCAELNPTPGSSAYWNDDRCHINQAFICEF